MVILKKKKILKELIGGAIKSFESELKQLGCLSLLPVVKFINNAEVEIDSLSSADEVAEGGLTFATDEKFLKKAIDNKAQAIIITNNLEIIAETKYKNINFIVTSEARLLFTFILKYVSNDYISSFKAGNVYFKDKKTVKIGKNVIIGEGSYIGSNVNIGDNVEIYPHCYIDDNVAINDDCVIFPKVVLFWGTVLGKRCKIYASAIIGNDGFGYNQLPDLNNKRLRHIKNTHLGLVIIEDDVEIGALTSIDRGLVSNTIIKSGTKIDNQVQIGHNCFIANDCIIVSQVGIAGHSHVKDRAFLLGQVGLGPGTVIGYDAIVAAQSGVTGTIPDGREPWMGSPVKPMKEEMAMKALSYRELPKLKTFFNLLKKASSFEELKNRFFEKK